MGMNCIVIDSNGIHGDGEFADAFREAARKKLGFIPNDRKEEDKGRLKMEKSMEDLRQELFELIENAYYKLCPEYSKRGPEHHEIHDALAEWQYQTADQIGPDYTMEDAKAEAEDLAKQDAERYAEAED